jgi:hypothetical protein
VTYLGSLGYFPAWSPVLPDDHPLERLLLTGGPVCAACLAWSCTLTVHTPHPKCNRLITGGPNVAPPPPEQVHNHNLSSVTLNYPCLVGRPRVISHNRTKRRVAGPVSRITLCVPYSCRFTYTLRIPDGDRTPMGAWGPSSMFLCVDGGHSRISDSTRQGAHRRHFLALMVDAAESPTAPTMGPAINVF